MLKLSRVPCVVAPLLQCLILSAPISHDVTVTRLRLLAMDGGDA